MKNAIVRVAFWATLAVVMVAPIWAVAAELDHVHLIADDTKAGVEWYAQHFGGTVPEGSSDTVLFGDTAFMMRAPEGEYSSNVGSAINHLSFSVPDVQAKMTELEEAGITVKRWGRNALNLPPVAALLNDPWGTRIEILSDDERSGFHHVHLKTRNPKRTAEWYAGAFDLEIGRYKDLSQIYALPLGDAYIFVQRSIRPVEPMIDRSVAHINLMLHDFDAAMKRLEAMNTKFLKDPHRSKEYMHATIEGPDGLIIELKANLPD
jgi:catechol 2,3-dioxygenase-like lactoylglutathione lyase family enzyme